MKTLEEKAEELIEKFLPYVDSTNVLSDEFDKNWRLRNAIQCAIICVDETINVCPYISKENCNTIEEIRSPENYFIEYWQEVKQILENKLCY